MIQVTFTNPRKRGIKTVAGRVKFYIDAPSAFNAIRKDGATVFNNECNFLGGLIEGKASVSGRGPVVATYKYVEDYTRALNTLPR